MEWISVKDRLPEEKQAVALINVNHWENVGGDWERNIYAAGYLTSWDGRGSPFWGIRGENAQVIEAYTHGLALPDSPQNTA